MICMKQYIMEIKRLQSKETSYIVQKNRLDLDLHKKLQKNQNRRKIVTFIQLMNNYKH